MCFIKILLLTAVLGIVSSATLGSSSDICGDGECGAAENRSNCVQDCPSIFNCKKRVGLITWTVYSTACSANPSCNSGDEVARCDYEEEGCETAYCGNSNCEAWRGETESTCAADCLVTAPPYNPGLLRSIQHGGLDRTYLLHVPACYNQGTKIPMVIAFHGGSGTGEAIEMQLGMNSRSEQACFIGVYPNGVSVDGTPGRDQHWNVGPRDSEWYDKVKDNDDVGFISALIDRLSIEYSIDKSRIYATGISNGAQMSYRLACELSGKIAAIAPISGGMVQNNCTLSRPVSIMHFHGTDDRYYPFNGGYNCAYDLGIWDNFESIPSVIERWKALDSCPSVSNITFQQGEVTCQTYSPCRNGSEVTLCTIAHGGHVVPGGYAFPSEKLMGGGKITRDIVAADAMWEFFQNHRLDTCGNGNCDAGENSANCALDCPVCGPADKNQDSVITLAELISHISAWRSGTFSLASLMSAISEWKNGC